MPLFSGPGDLNGQTCPAVNAPDVFGPVAAAIMEPVLCTSVTVWPESASESGPQPAVRGQRGQSEPASWARPGRARSGRTCRVKGESPQTPSRSEHTLFSFSRSHDKQTRQQCQRWMAENNCHESLPLQMMQSDVDAPVMCAALIHR